MIYLTLVDLLPSRSEAVVDEVMPRNHALVDGNKRLALAALVAFYGCNGRRLTLSNDAAYDFITAIAAGRFDTVEEIAGQLEQAARSWR